MGCGNPYEVGKRKDQPKEDERTKEAFIEGNGQIVLPCNLYSGEIAKIVPSGLWLNDLLNRSQLQKFIEELEPHTKEYYIAWEQYRYNVVQGRKVPMKEIHDRCTRAIEGIIYKWNENTFKPAGFTAKNDLFGLLKTEFKKAVLFQRNA